MPEVQMGFHLPEAVADRLGRSREEVMSCNTMDSMKRGLGNLDCLPVIKQLTVSRARFDSEIIHEKPQNVRPRPFSAGAKCVQVWETPCGHNSSKLPMSGRPKHVVYRDLPSPEHGSRSLRETCELSLIRRTCRTWTSPRTHGSRARNALHLGPNDIRGFGVLQVLISYDIAHVGAGAIDVGS